MIIVGIVLWQSGVFGVQTGGITGFQGRIEVSDYAASTNSLQVYIQNVAGQPLRNINVSLTVNGQSSSTSNSSVSSLATGKSATVTLSDPNICASGASSFTADAKITYQNTVSGLTKTETGTISGQCP